MALASKRKRLQVRLKTPITGGSKIIFSPLGKDFLLGAPVNKIIAPATQSDQISTGEKTEEKILKPKLGGSLLRPPLSVPLSGPLKGPPSPSKSFRLGAESTSLQPPVQHSAFTLPQPPTLSVQPVPVPLFEATFEAFSTPTPSPTKSLKPTVQSFQPTLSTPSSPFTPPAKPTSQSLNRELSANSQKLNEEIEYFPIRTDLERDRTNSQTGFSAFDFDDKSSSAPTNIKDKDDKVHDDKNTLKIDTDTGVEKVKIKSDTEIIVIDSSQLADAVAPIEDESKSVLLLQSTISPTSTPQSSSIADVIFHSVNDKMDGIPLQHTDPGTKIPDIDPKSLSLTHSQVSIVDVKQVTLSAEEKEEKEVIESVKEAVKGALTDIIADIQDGDGDIVVPSGIKSVKTTSGTIISKEPTPALIVTPSATAAPTAVALVKAPTPTTVITAPPSTSIRNINIAPPPSTTTAATATGTATAPFTATFTAPVVAETAASRRLAAAVAARRKSEGTGGVPLGLGLGTKPAPLGRISSLGKSSESKGT